MRRTVRRRARWLWPSACPSAKRMTLMLRTRKKTRWTTKSRLPRSSVNTTVTNFLSLSPPPRRPPPLPFSASRSTPIRKLRRLLRGTSWTGNNDAMVQFTVNALRVKFQNAIGDSEERKAFVYRLARLVKSYHFLRCFFTYPKEIQEFAAFAEYVGPQLIKQGSVSDLMKQIRQTDVVKASVQYQGEVRSGGPVKLKPGKGRRGAGPPPKKVS